MAKPHGSGQFPHTRIPPAENGDWILLVLLIVSRVDLIVFVLFLETVDVREYHTGVLLYGSRKSVGSSVLRAFTASNACFARDEPSSRRVGGVGL